MKKKQRDYQRDLIEVETLYKAEEPFMPIKEPYHGYQGVILRNKLNDTIQCHECGLWFKYLAPHIKHAHKSNIHDYKKKFSLPLGAALCSKALSSSLSATAMKWNVEDARKKVQGKQHRRPKDYMKRLKYGLNCMGRINSIGACEEQVKARYISIMDFLGHEPSRDEIDLHDSALRNIISRRYGGLNEFKTKYNLGTPRGSSKRYSRERLIAEIRSKFIQYGKSLTIQHFRDGVKPDRKTILKRFGSWNRALTSAGIV